MNDEQIIAQGAQTIVNAGQNIQSKLTLGNEDLRIGVGCDKGDRMALAYPKVAGRGIDAEIVGAGDGLNARVGLLIEEWTVIQRA